MKNLFDPIPGGLAEEFFETLAEAPGLRVERIVSNGQSSPAQGWYDQAGHEFVALLSGAARIEYDDGSAVELAPGDWLDIPAHRRHRVAWTADNTETVWLAVHYGKE